MAEKNKMVRCINCKNGNYVQWFHNPIICNCSVFDEKFVAEARRLCDQFIKRSRPVDCEHEVTHHNHY